MAPAFGLPVPPVAPPPGRAGNEAPRAHQGRRRPCAGDRHRLGGQDRHRRHEHRQGIFGDRTRGCRHPMAQPRQGARSRMDVFEIQCCGSRRPGSSGEAMQACREPLEVAQPAEIWMLRSVHQAAKGFVRMSVGRAFPNCSKPTGFCLDQQGVVWRRASGGARPPGLIEAWWEVGPCLPPLRRIRGSAPPGLIEARSAHDWTHLSRTGPGAVRK